MRRSPPKLTMRQYEALDRMDEEARVVGWYERVGTGVVLVVRDGGGLVLVTPSGATHEL